MGTIAFQKAERRVSQVPQAFPHRTKEQKGNKEEVARWCASQRSGSLPLTLASSPEAVSQLITRQERRELLRVVITVVLFAKGSGP